MLEDIIARIKAKKKKLDKFKPIPAALIKNLEEWFRVELTYTSNAIEGNTLSRIETANIIEKGITTEGKSLKEHQEAINHAAAFEYVKKFTNRKRQDLNQENILEIHKIILNKIDDSQAGRYRSVSVRIAGSNVILPNPLKVPQKMDEYEEWLKSPNKGETVKIAADAHLKLVTIHPFVDGNGRTARLFMNLILMQASFPPAIIRREDRRKYIEAIENAQLGKNTVNYYEVIYKAIERSLDIYFEALENKEEKKTLEKEKLLKIGELAEKTGETIHTLRFWTKEGLLTVADYTKGGYQLFDISMIVIIKRIRRLQKEKRLTIKEIRNRYARIYN